MKHYVYFIILLLCLSSDNSFGQILSGQLNELFEQGKVLHNNKKFAEATVVFNQLVDLAEEKKNAYKLAEIYYEIGNFYHRKHIPNKALTYLFGGVETLAKNYPNASPHAYFVRNGTQNTHWGIPYSVKELRDVGAKLLCETYNLIGGVFLNKNDLTKAESYWQKTLEVSKANEILKSHASALNNLGEIKRLGGQDAEALSLYKEALESNKRIKDSLGINVNLANIATIYMKLDKVDSAKAFYDKCYESAKLVGSDFILMNAFYNYGCYYKHVGHVAQSITWYSKGLDIAQRTKDMNYSLDIFQSLVELYEKQLMFKSALYYQKKWIAVKKENTLQENKKLALEVEAQYHIDEKDKELSYLRDKTQIEAYNTQLNNRIQWAFIIGLFLVLAFTLIILRLRNKNNKKLESNFKLINQQNEEKEILLKEIHHRVKNNLQVITSLLSLQAYNIEDIKTKELFSYSQYRINSMAMIHEMLYQSNQLTKINYKGYLDQLVDALVSSMKGGNHNVEVCIEAPNVFLNIDTAIPLGLLINEIITNALKYGIPGNSEGILSIKITELAYPNFVLKIGDNGHGFPTETNYKTTNSLGLKLIRKLTKQLNGKIEREQNKKGTNYILSFQEIAQKYLPYNKE